MDMQANDESFMRLALKEAQKAFDKNEVPVGAVAVKEGKVIAKAHNIREKTHDLLGHAEILLLKKLSSGLKDWRLQGVTLYVTLEPCLMCLGAILEGRISHLVYGAPDPSAGALQGFYHLAKDIPELFVTVVNS